MEPTESINQKQIHFCVFCGGRGTTRHHFTPKSHRIGGVKQETLRLCRDCHDDVHHLFSHEELATKFWDRQKLEKEFDHRVKTSSRNPEYVIRRMTALVRNKALGFKNTIEPSSSPATTDDEPLQ